MMILLGQEAALSFLSTYNDPCGDYYRVQTVFRGLFTEEGNRVVMLPTTNRASKSNEDIKKPGYL